MLHRFLPLIGARRGAIDWCIRVDDIRDAVLRLRDAGIDMVDEMEFDRERPDGLVARWLLAGRRDVRRVDQARGDVVERVPEARSLPGGIELGEAAPQSGFVP